MLKSLAVLALLLAPSADFAWVPFHVALREAELVILGEVVEIRRNESGQRGAAVRPTKVFKGECPERVLFLPIPDPPSAGVPQIACRPPRVEYVKGRTCLLLLVRSPGLTEIHAQFSPAVTPDHQYVKLVPILLDLLEGRNVDERVKELGPLIDKPVHCRLAYEAVELLPRREARPLLPAARRYFQQYSGHWSNAFPDAFGESYVQELISHSRWTLDFRLLALARPHLKPRSAFLPAASRVCGRSFSTIEEFDAWWERARIRANATDPQARARAAELIPGFRSTDTRAGSAQRLLDLGPSILPAIASMKDDPDDGVRLAASSLEEELKILQEFREDMAK